MGDLKDWRKEDWVRIGTDGEIKGECGTSKDKKNPDRCLPRNKAQSLSTGERAATAKKKKLAGSKGETVVKNTKPATVKLRKGGLARGKRSIATGCGQVMENRRKKTLYV
jgi:hypothetical protein